MPHKNIEERRAYKNAYYRRRAKVDRPTTSQIRETFLYDPHAGTFENLKTGNVVIGKNTTLGYRQIWVSGKPVMAHRLAWLLHYGDWPSAVVDHINGNTSDNRISNLRLATPSQNQHNAKIRVDNVSGHKGVTQVGERWIAHLHWRGKRVFSKSFKSKEEAVSARRRAAEHYFGEFMHTSEVES